MGCAKSYNNKTSVNTIPVYKTNEVMLRMELDKINWGSIPQDEVNNAFDTIQETFKFTYKKCEIKRNPINGDKPLIKRRAKKDWMTQRLKNLTKERDR